MPKKNVLVTGAASGIGAAIAEAFAAEGYCVALFDIDEQKLLKTGGAIAAGAQILTIRGDVNNPEDAQRAAMATVARFGTLDVLVNNAGIEIAGSVAAISAEEWDRLMGVNLRGAFLMSKFAVQLMKAGSSITNISSVHAFASYPDCAAYDASKAGLLGLTRAMALDHGAAGIRVNAVCPGYIDTPLLESWLRSVDNREAALSRLRSLHPARRIGTPADVAHAVLFLSSERASFITGASLVVDGGMTLSGK